MKKNLGFTLTEVIIVIVIVGILSLISVPIYRDHVQKSVAVEGQALLSEVMAAQEIFQARNKAWFESSTHTAMSSNYVSAIGVDARRNKYFNSFTWQSIDNNNNDDAISFTINTTGLIGTRAEGISLTLNYYKGRAYEIIQNSDQH